MNDAADVIARVAAALEDADGEGALARCEPALAAIDPDDPLRPALEALCGAARATLARHRQGLIDRERLDMLSRASFEGLIMHVDGVVVDANERFAEIVGYAPDEIVGLNALDVMVAPESRPEVLRRMTEGIEGSYVIVGIRKDGSRFPAELDSKQGHLGERPVRVVGVRDITERERTERRLRESEARLQRLIGHTFDVMNISRNGVVIEISGDVEALFGVPPEHFRGRPVQDYVAPESREIVRAITAEQREGPYEASILHADGSSVPVMIVSTPATLDGEDVRIAGIRDLRATLQADEDRRDLEQQVERAQRLESLGVLAGGIAHDFNNLLVSILGNADLLRADVTTPAQVKHLDGIVSASQRAAELTAQMLAYAGEGDLGQRTAIGLEALVGELRTLLQASLSKKATLELDFSKEQNLVLADRGALGQVVLNLLTNASDAIGDRSGTIRVSTRRVRDPGPAWYGALGATALAGDWVLLEVSDTGEGMDPATQARIFEPFFTTKPQGHGLGLAACLGIVRGHGGAIRVESRPGEGTHFYVLLPRARAVDAAVSPADPHASSLPLPRAVLVVDDEVAIRSFVRSALEWADFTVDEAGDGEEALARLAAHDFDLVLLDVTMPKLDGVEVVRRLRDQGDDVPVILTSGYSDVGVETRLAPGSFQGFLRKPYRVQHLYDAIRQVLPNALDGEPG
jgi:PAS domain S-box-containing protein